MVAPSGHPARNDSVLLRRRRAPIWLIAVALAIGTWVGPALAQSARSQESLIWGYVRGPQTLDPHDVTTSPDRALAKFNVFDGLVALPTAFPDDGSPAVPVPALAESWEISDDGFTWTFRLRRGVPFHRGFGEFTSRDAVFSIERLLDPDTSLRNQGHVAAIERVEAVDPYTVRLHLVSPWSPLLTELAFLEGLMMVSQDAVEQLGDAGFAERPVGTGAYEVVAFEPGGPTVLQAFADHWRGAPSIPRIEVRVIADETVAGLALLNDEVNFLIVRDPEVFRMLQAAPQVHLEMHPTATYMIGAFWLNTQRGPLTDVRVRQALAHALDRHAIYEQFFATMHPAGVAETIFPTGVFGHRHVEGTVPSYDPERARELLAEAGYGPGEVRLIAHTFAQSEYVTMLTAAQQYWAEVGVILDIQRTENANWQALNIHQADFDVFAVLSTRVEAEDVAGSLLSQRSVHLGGVGNWAQYVNPRVDELVEQQRRATDPAAREALLHELQEVVMADLPIIPIWYGSHISAWPTYLEGPEQIGGWRFDGFATRFVDE
jgi:peptide/nickel transport system substrate-binding protein